MWNYIQSRLTDMPQNFWGLDFIQALNPLYALPIVAVILCAVLVYAFGFKSPVQPPSFDEIENDKKTTKKRKGKENQKNKQHNSKIGSSGKGSDNSSSEKKKKTDKPSPAVKPSSKPETKVVKRVTIADRKKKPSINQEPDLHFEDGNDEGWVHHVSKKGRKNRKKDDIGHVDTTILSASSHSNIAEISCNLTENDVKPQIESREVNQCSDVFTTNENRSEKSLVKEVPLVKLALKKQKAKKRGTEKNELVDDFDAVLAGELNENVASVNNGFELGIHDIETSKISKEKKSKKKKKKHEMIDEKKTINIVDSSAVNASNQNCITNGTTNAVFSSDSERHDYITIEKGNLNEPNNMNAGVKGEKDVNDTNLPIEATGSNVVFDELEGLYPQSKPAKKKKKVRRDH